MPMESLPYPDPLAGACLPSTIHAPVDGIAIMVYKSLRLLLKGFIIEKCVEMLFNGVAGMRQSLENGLARQIKFGAKRGAAISNNRPGRHTQ